MFHLKKLQNKSTGHTYFQIYTIQFSQVTNNITKLSFIVIFITIGISLFLGLNAITIH